MSAYLEGVVIVAFALVTGFCGGVALSARCGALEVHRVPEEGRLETCEAALGQVQRSRWEALGQAQECTWECQRLVVHAREDALLHCPR